MSDLGLYVALASAALRRCGNDQRRLHRTLRGFESEFSKASTPECREGFALVIARLKEKLATWPELPMGTERGG